MRDAVAHFYIFVYSSRVMIAAEGAANIEREIVMNTVYLNGTPFFTMQRARCRAAALASGLAPSRRSNAGIGRRPCRDGHSPHAARFDIARYIAIERFRALYSLSNYRCILVQRLLTSRDRCRR